MHVSERPLDDNFAGRGVRKHRPICARDIALPQGFLPKLKQPGRIPCFGVTGNCSAMAAVERLLEEPGTLFSAARQHHPEAVQIMIGGSGRTFDCDLLQDLAKLGRRKASAYNRTMQVGAELPDARAADALHREGIRLANGIVGVR